MNDEKVTVKSFLGGMVLILFFMWLVIGALIGCGQNIIVNGEAWNDTDLNGVGDRWSIDPFSLANVDTAQHVSDGAIWQQFTKQGAGTYRLSLHCGSIQPVTVSVGTLTGLDQQYVVMPTSWGENVVFIEPQHTFNSIHFSSSDWFVLDHVELIKVAGLQAVSIEAMGENYVKQGRSK